LLTYPYIYLEPLGVNPESNNHGKKKERVTWSMFINGSH
jgi:hypothetical protein